VRAALALPEVQASEMAQAWALYVGAVLAASQSDHVQAREMLERCLVLRRQLGREVDIAATLSTLAESRRQGGDAAGAAENEREALQIFRQIGDRIGEAISLLHLGQFNLWLGDDAAAASDLEQALAIALEIGHREVEAECELVLGELAFGGGNADEAGTRFGRSLEICREAADKHGEARALWWEGRVALSTGDTATAHQRLGEALRAFQSYEMREELLGCLEDHAALHAAEGQPVAGVRLASAAAAMRERLTLVQSPRAEAKWQERLAKLREALQEPDFGQEWEEGKRWATEEAVRAALAPAAGPR